MCIGGYSIYVIYIYIIQSLIFQNLREKLIGDKIDQIIDGSNIIQKRRNIERGENSNFIETYKKIQNPYGIFYYYVQLYVLLDHRLTN